MSERICIWTLEGIGEVVAGDDLAALIAEAVQAGGEPLEDGDVLSITSKIMSKAEGRMRVAADREEAITAETVRLVASRTNADGSVLRIVENRLGIVAAAAGVDSSNTAEGTVLLLPEDPDASARRIAATLRERWGIRLGVIVSDTLGRPWRDGQTDVAIGAAGIHVFHDLQGTLDAAGRKLSVTKACLADEIAGAVDLVKGKTSGMPVAVVRGLGRFVGDLDLPGAASIVRLGPEDLFRLGTDEAYRQGFEDGAESER